MTALKTTNFQEVDMWLSAHSGCRVRIVALASVIFCRTIRFMSSVVLKVAPRYLISSCLVTGVTVYRPES